jgi:DedD protein
MLDQVQLKQRIVGGIVLLSLAVIVAPFLTDDPRQEVKILESNVKPWPDDPPLNLIEISDEEFSPIVEPLAQSPQPASVGSPAAAEQPQRAAAAQKIVANTVTQLPLVSKTSTQTAPQTVSRAAPKAAPKKQSSSTGKQWEVQVVSYGRSSRKRAERFLKRMKEKGFEVQIKEGKRQLRLVTTPLPSEKAANEMKKKIDRTFKVDRVSAMVRLLK